MPSSPSFCCCCVVSDATSLCLCLWSHLQSPLSACFLVSSLMRSSYFVGSSSSTKAPRRTHIHLINTGTQLSPDPWGSEEGRRPALLAVEDLLILPRHLGHGPVYGMCPAYLHPCHKEDAPRRWFYQSSCTLVAAKINALACPWPTEDEGLVYKFRVVFISPRTIQ